MAHSENLLLTMLADPEGIPRKKAVEQILQLRNGTSVSDCHRKFLIPKLNFDAENYFDMIDWTSETIFEPPLTGYYLNYFLKLRIELLSSIQG